ncbi:G-protein gamma-like domain-containing protein [Dichotomocladium elegans]|nr:G-protein gamma-like domain-containing protein [Dichotomocladium elegans]
MNARRTQNLSEAKLNRLLEYNQRLRELLDIPRTTVSESSTRVMDFCKNTHDPLVPSVWGHSNKKEDPFHPASRNKCCNIM